MGRSPVSGVVRNLSRRQLLTLMGVGGLTAGATPTLLAACSSDAKNVANTSIQAVPKFVAATGNPPQTKWDPALALGVVETSINNHLHESLVSLDPVTRKLSPGLALEMPSTSDSVVTVRLRDAQFHTGAPVTADDVKFSFDRIKDQATGSPLAGFLTGIKQVQAKDDQTVVFTLDKPATYLAGRLALVKILPRNAFSGGADAFQSKPIGCGPYQFVEYQTNDHVTIKLFEGYNGARKRGPDEVALRPIVDDNARLAALVGKQINLMDNVPYGDADGLKKQSGLKVQGVTSNNASILLFHTGKKPFDDKRVRQAFLYAIDRDAILRDIFHGGAVAASGPLSPKHPDYVKPSIVYTFDPAKAKQLLADAGYPGGLDVPMYVSQAGYLKTQGPVIQSSAAAAGFRITLIDGTFAKVTDGTFQVYLAATDPSIFGYDADVLLRYLYVGNLAKQFMRWEGPAAAQVASLMDQASSSTDATVQRQLWGQVQSLIAEEAPASPLHYLDQITGWTSDMSWYTPLPASGFYVAGGLRR